MSRTRVKGCNSGSCKSPVVEVMKSTHGHWLLMSSNQGGPAKLLAGLPWFEMCRCTAECGVCSKLASMLAPLQMPKPFCPAAQDEASALLSALATALSNCRLTWPAFLPVHDPLRDACWGIAISGHGTIHYDSDSTHSSMWSQKIQQVSF